MSKKNKKKIKEIASSDNVKFKVFLYKNIFNNFDINGKKIINKIKNDEALLNKIFNCWLPKSIESLCSNDIIYIPQNIEAMLEWLVFMINLFKSKINDYLVLKKEYERFLFSLQYDKAYEILKKIESDICISLWSIQQSLLLDELIGGLKQNKEHLGKYLIESSRNSLIQIVINFYSKQAEIDTSYDNYQETLKNFVKKYDKVPLLACYINYKLNLECEVDKQNYVIPLEIDSQMSIIDLYETTIDILQQICALDIKETNLTNFLYKIKIKKDHRINNMLCLYKNNICESCLFDNNFYEILELYTIGKYNETKKLLEEYLSNHSEVFQAYILLVKCHIKSKQNFHFKFKLITDFYNIYMLNEKYNDSYINIEFYYKILNGTSWKYKLKGFLDRKCNIIDSIFYKKLTYLNDTYITPSYIFNMYDKSISMNLLRQLTSICPFSTNLYLNVYKSFFECETIEDEFRKDFYYAQSLIEKKDYDNAIQKLEDLFKKQNKKDLYHLEKISRKLYYAYIEQNDLLKIIYFTIKVFFMNQNLIKKFDFNLIKERIYNLDIETLKKDIKFPIFIYIIDRDNLNWQRIAYSNFMDYNEYNTIYDIISKGSFNYIYLQFFLYNICTINIIKRDIRVIVSETSAEDIRIDILKYLMAKEKGKKKGKENIYLDEIIDIMKRKNIRNNIKQINHSRIFIDYDNIKKSFNKMFKEEFNKYLSIKKFENDIQTLDIDDDTTILCSTDKIESKRKNSVEYNQAYLVIKNLSKRILEEFLFNAQYGLNIFLSSRIRHGYCKSSIKFNFEECHLLSQKENESTTVYYINKYWEKKFINNTDLYDKVKIILSDFTIIIEKKIEEVKEKWVKIKLNKEGIGDFDYSRFIDIFISMAEKENFLDFDNYYKMFVTFFGETTNFILGKLRDKIKIELSNFFIEELNKLEQKILNINNMETSVIINSINKCKSKISISMSQFAEIFYFKHNIYSDFNCKDVIETCIEINKNINTEFNKVKISQKIEKEYLIKGSYFPFFVDMFNQIICNAIEHSKLQLKNLKLDIIINSDVETILENDVSHTFKYDENAHYLNINFINNMSSTINPNIVNKKVGDIFAKFNNKEILEKYSQTEGGSGLYKLRTIVHYHIYEKYLIYYSVEERKFSLGIILEIDKLKVGGE